MGSTFGFLFIASCLLTLVSSMRSIKFVATTLITDLWPSSIHVGGHVDFIGQAVDRNLEAFLHAVENIRILMRGNEGNCKTLCPEAPGAADLSGTRDKTEPITTC